MANSKLSIMFLIFFIIFKALNLHRMNNRYNKSRPDPFPYPHIRAFVAEKILESLDIGEDKEISNEWKAEISRRCKEIDEGNVELVDAKEVFSRAYSVLE